MSMAVGANAITDVSNRNTHRRVFMWLLCADLALIAAHLVAMLWPDLLTDPRWSVEYDGGFGEDFQYLKWALLSLTFAVVAWKQRAIGFLAWSLLFGYLLLDDRLQLHERGGVYFAARLDLSWVPYLRPRDVGELISVALVGAALMLPIAAFWRFGSAAVRRTTEDMAVLMLMLVAFGVGVDALHSALLHAPALADWLGLIEDGGEMIVASLMAAYAVALGRQAPRPAYANAVRSRRPRSR
jgi:hypothetical protein